MLEQKMQYRRNTMQQLTRVHQSNRGFTLLELMVATSVFTVILLVLTVGVISFSKSYFSSVTRSNTQAVARAVVNDITQSIQYGKQVKTGLVNGNSKGFCIDSTLYSYALGYKVTSSPGGGYQSRYGLVKSTGTVCAASTPYEVTTLASLPLSSDHELLGDNMRLLQLDVQEVSDGTYEVSVRVASGDDDLLGIATGFVATSDADWLTFGCQGGSGTQFCALSNLTTTVQQRAAE